MKDYEQIHDIILEKVDDIKKQFDKFEARIMSLEEKYIELKNDSVKALNIVSGHSHIISYYKQERDKAQEDLIKQQAEIIEKMKNDWNREREKVRLEKELFNKRVMIAVISAIGFILISLGYIRPEVFKIFLGIL